MTTLRTDALRNRERLLTAARDRIACLGPDLALETVAEHAGVGIATLYRRFPDRGTLLTAVVVEALVEAGEIAKTAHDGTGDGLDAIGRYMDAMLDGQAAAVIPMLIGRPDIDADPVASTRRSSTAAVRALVDAAYEDGSLPAVITVGDIGSLLVRLSRPLPGDMPSEEERRLARRHLAVVLAGLRAAPHDLETGPSLTDLAHSSRTAHAVDPA